MKMPVEKIEWNKLLSYSKFCGSYGKVILHSIIEMRQPEPQPAVQNASQDLQLIRRLD